MPGCPPQRACGSISGRAGPGSAVASGPLRPSERPACRPGAPSRTPRLCISCTKQLPSQLAAARALTIWSWHAAMSKHTRTPAQRLHLHLGRSRDSSDACMSGVVQDGHGWTIAAWLLGPSTSPSAAGRAALALGGRQSVLMLSCTLRWASRTICLISGHLP